jgi:phospholipase C
MKNMAVQSAESRSSIKHVLISCQENRSFDHYFGSYAYTGRYGIPPGWSQPDGQGGAMKPEHFTSLSTPDVGHFWGNIHSEWNNGKMNGFSTTNGRNAMGYYTQIDLPFYYALARNFTLCGNYFCSVLGPTDPNRMYLVSGTSGGWTNNNVTMGSLTYPMILDVLDAHHITFKNYNVGEGVAQEGDNELLWWAKWVNDQRLQRPLTEYFSDLQKDTLPQVCFFTGGTQNDEHPPENIQVGQAAQKTIITALMKSRAWASSAFFLTYDEAGGFFDHVAPPVLDTFGAGMRVPTIVVSPFAKRGHIEGTRYEHSSILKFIEKVFSLPTLASINHQFDIQTPGLDGNNDAASQHSYGPPAPPRDGRTDIGNMTECFHFI